MNFLYRASILIYLLLFISIFSGCYYHEVLRMDTTNYLRYIKDDAPPLLEWYSHKKNGLLLTSVFYDSNGDWVLDCSLEFSECRYMDYVKTVKFSDGSNYAPRSEVKKMLIKKGLAEDLAEERLELPEELDIWANNKRYSSPEYQEVVKNILKFWREGKYKK